MNDNTKIVKSLKESSLLIEDISKKTNNEVDLLEFYLAFLVMVY